MSPNIASPRFSDGVQKTKWIFPIVKQKLKSVTKSGQSRFGETPRDYELFMNLLFKLYGVSYPIPVGQLRNIDQGEPRG